LAPATLGPCLVGWKSGIATGGAKPLTVDVWATKVNWEHSNIPNDHPCPMVPYFPFSSMYYGTGNDEVWK